MKSLITFIIVNILMSLSFSAVANSQTLLKDFFGELSFANLKNEKDLDLSDLLVFTEKASAVDNSIEHVLFDQGEILRLSNGEVYKIISQIGHGGFGTVYRTRCIYSQLNPELINIEVAVKVIALPKNQARLAKTIKDNNLVLGQLTKNHNSFAQIHSVSEVLNLQGHSLHSIAVAMEFLDGKDLFQFAEPLLIENHLFNSEIVTRLDLIDKFIDFSASAISFFVENDFVFGDFNPHNIVLTRSGEFKLIDFDMVDFKKMGALGYKIEFAPSETIFQESLVGASDSYGLGASLVYFLLGESPLRVYLENEKDLSLEKLKNIMGSEQLHSNMLKVVEEKLLKAKSQFKNDLIRYRIQKLIDLALNLLSFDPYKRKKLWQNSSCDSAMRAVLKYR